MRLPRTPSVRPPAHTQTYSCFFWCLFQSRSGPCAPVRSTSPDSGLPWMHAPRSGQHWPLRENRQFQNIFPFFLPSYHIFAIEICCWITLRRRAFFDLTHYIIFLRKIQLFFLIFHSLRRCPPGSTGCRRVLSAQCRYPARDTPGDGRNHSPPLEGSASTIPSPPFSAPWSRPPGPSGWPGGYSGYPWRSQAFRRYLPWSGWRFFSPPPAASKGRQNHPAPFRCTAPLKSSCSRWCPVPCSFPGRRDERSFQYPPHRQPPAHPHPDIFHIVLPLPHWPLHPYTAPPASHWPAASMPGRNPGCIPQQDIPLSSARWSLLPAFSSSYVPSFFRVIHLVRAAGPYGSRSCALVSGSHALRSFMSDWFFTAAVPSVSIFLFGRTAP